MNRLQQRKDHFSIRDIYREPYPSLRDSLEIQEECNFSDKIYDWIAQQQSQQERNVFCSRLKLAQNTSDEGKEAQAIKYAEEAYLFLKSLYFDLHFYDDKVTFYTYLARLEHLLGKHATHSKIEFQNHLKKLGIIIPTSIHV